MIKQVIILCLLCTKAFAYTQADVDCLAAAIYREAANQRIEGRIAVASVVLNRLVSKRFPTTVCGVVKQHKQFSWFKGGSVNAYVNHRDKRYSEAVVMAHSILHSFKSGEKYSNVGNALYFHARYVNPRWKRVRVVARIQDHVFYEQTGGV